MREGNERLFMEGERSERERGIEGFGIYLFEAFKRGTATKRAYSDKRLC